MPRLGCIRRDARFGALPFPARNQWSARFHQWDLELVGHAIAFSVGDKSPSLTMWAVSGTFLSAHRHALVEERHFAIVRFSNLGLASNRWGQKLGPTQPSLRSPTAIMITCSNSLQNRERDTQSLRRRFTFRHRDFRALPRANRNV